MNKEKTNKNSEISARVTEMLICLGENKNAFANRLGYERAQTVYDIVNGKSAPSYDFFKRFQLSEYSDIISIDWLLTGRGNMLRNSEHFEALTDNHPQNPDLISLLKEQQTKITEQAIEIGMLRERLKLMEEERKLSEDVEAAGVAAVG